MTPPTPSRDNPAGLAYNELRNLARRDGRDFAEYITLYALEGFLARLTCSEHADDFVLKGGVLMSAFAARRPTRDIDFAASGFASDISSVEQRVRNIIKVHRNDGLLFDPYAVMGEQIREDADYTGVRVKITARLATAQVAMHIDVNFGDPVWPAPTEAVLPLLLGGTLTLAGYPDHMVLAEKIVTAIERGEQNTRWRDFADIAAIARTRSIQGADLRSAIDTVANYRQVKVEPLGTLTANMPGNAQRRWEIWRKKQRLEGVTPSSFAELLNQCLSIAEPILTGVAVTLVWQPEAKSWSAEIAESHEEDAG